MSVTTDLLATWTAPRAALRRHLARGPSEAFAFSLLLVFLVLLFVSHWPVAAREAWAAGEPSAAPRILAFGFGVLAAIPLCYALAALGRIAGRLLGGRGSWYAARIALFWALATVGPLILLQGLVAGLVGPGSGLWLVRAMIALAFFWLWLTMLHEAERG